MTYTTCPHCGAHIVSKAGDPSFSALLSIIPGIGQIHNGEVFKGMSFVLTGIALMTMTIFLVGISILLPIFIPTIGFIILMDVLFWILNIFDAYRGAKKV